MDTDTKNVIFKVFVIIVILIALYFAYKEIWCRKAEQKIEKVEKKVG